MVEHGFPVLFALFAWWFSTGLILYLDGLPQHTFRWSVLGATGLLGIGLAGIAHSAALTTVAGAYCAFSCGLLVWGWSEVSFLLGYVTGPNRTACPEAAGPWLRFCLATRSVLYHELAIAGLALAILALTWDAPNRLALWTFLVLWGMRLSAKFNLFLGVRNLSEEFLPQHLRYLASFFVRRPMNLLFPVSVTVSTGLGVALIQHATAPGTAGFEAVGASFLATLVMLALLEHWFMVVPLPANALWGWSFKSHDATRAAQEAERKETNSVGAGRLDDRRPVPAVQQSWSVHLPSPCNRHSLQAVLEAVAGGAFGDIEHVGGVTRDHTGWVRFYVADGRTGVAPLAGGSLDVARVVAVGKRFDADGLQAAFDACAVPATVGPP